MDKDVLLGKYIYIEDPKLVFFEHDAIPKPILVNSISFLQNVAGLLINNSIVLPFPRFIKLMEIAQELDKKGNK